MLISKRYTHLGQNSQIGHPYITVQICNEWWDPFRALVDTGYYGGLLVSKRIFDENGGLDVQDKTSKDPIPITMANGDTFYVDVYEVTFNIETIQIREKIRVPVKDANFLHDAFIGRKLIDKYRVTFDGKSTRQTIEFD